jgi:hypothetical protein
MRLVSRLLSLAPLFLIPGEHGLRLTASLTYPAPFPSIISTYQEAPFLDLVTWLGVRTFDRSGWSLSVVQHNVQYPLRRAKDVPRRVRDWATSPIGQYKVKAGELREAREKAFFGAHLSEVDTLFHGLSIIGGNLGEFISDDGLPPPIGLAVWKGGTTILVSGVATRLFFPVQTREVAPQF